jgi:putative hemolysin
VNVVGWNILLVIVFVLIGGFFAGAEIALVSLRDSQIKQLSQRGRRGAVVARLAEDPNRFLSAVQIGVTLMGFLSAAFGAATLADGLASALRDWGLSPALADTAALVAITLVISYFSLVFGELAPKRLALQRVEGFALMVAPILDRVARLSRPAIWLLGKSTDLVVRLLGGDPRAQREQITEEELRDIVAGHETLGREEQRLIKEVFEAGERQIREVMLPRTEVDFLDDALPVFRAARQVANHPHSRYPVVRGSQDDVIGFVHVRDILSPNISGRSVRLGEIARDVKMLPATKRVLSALNEMRREGHHIAIVIDEYGGTAGIVTLEDLVEELVGDIRDEYDVEEDHARRNLSGDLEVDGLLNLDDFAETTGITLPEGPYETVAGFVMNRLGHLPQVGELVDVDGHRLTVTELDGRRVARLRLTKIPSAVAPAAPAQSAAESSAASAPEPEPLSEPAAAPPPAPAAANHAGENLDS